MIPFLSEASRPEPAETEHELHVVVLVRDIPARYLIANRLRDAGYRVTTAPPFGAVELLRASAGAFDLLVTSQSLGEMSQFGLPQLARSVRPDLPILVLESDTVRGEGVVEAVHAAISRWPMRDRPVPSLH